MTSKTRTMVLACLLCSGCFSTRLIVDSAARSDISNEYDGKWYHDFVFALVEGSPSVPLDTVCPNGVAVIEQETTFLNGLVKALVGWLYTPQSVTVYCKAAGPSSAAPAPK